MGKRKERRLAASNRRVKLDLLAQPSGDFGDSTYQEEVGGVGNAQNHAESSNSPSSSDQRPENPLLLLGQYSDEEIEEESGKETNQDTREKSSTELDEQVKVDNHDGPRNVEDENLIAAKVNQENKDPSSSLDVLLKLQENGVIEDNKTESPHRDADAMDQASVPWTSEMQTGDMDSGWKMVLHEESNSYYYWNIVTGETSWEVPAVLTQGNQSTYDPQAVPEVEESHVTSVDTQPNRSTNDMVFEATEVDGFRPELEGHNEKYPDIMENDKNVGDHSNTIDGVNYLSSHEGFSSHYYDALSNGEVHHTDSSIQDMSGHVYQPTVGDSSSDSFRLLQLGENLSERLKSLKGFRSEGFNDQIAKLMFELDMRLADIKSLVPYGSSLLPFWLHSENQLKKLEAAVNNEVLKHSEIANICETNKAENKSQEKTTANEKNPASTSLVFDGSDHTTISKEVVEANETEIPLDTFSNVALRSVEDVDMDVEMEVEDELGLHNRPDHSIPPIPHEQHDSRESEEEFDIPLPPNEEWIPPPPPDDESLPPLPPDDEPLPPPPPDEPPEVAFPLPPSELQTAQPYTYGEQYSYTYPGSGFEYYGQTNSLTTEVPSNGYYVDANGCQVAAPLPTLYYAAVPNPYPDSTLVMTPSEPAAYYTLQEGIASDQTEPSTEVPSISASTVKSNASLVSAPVVATTVAPTEPVPKVQPKVTRNKKRTVATVPSLRSNKKVSGLVDKWKAVKEELHEDEEDEPENAYEVLEKKRQREIEQWLALQVATGEAKDNANFQPLGGDWRERVRQKRAKKSTEAEEKVAKAFDVTNKQPDLVELTKQLPTGWQAYWDEASKQVYYVNSSKSETTWTKPTN